MMTAKSTFLGMTTGVAAGLIVGTTVGLLVKGMLKQKTPVMKKVSKAFSSVGDLFNNLAKFTG